MGQRENKRNNRIQIIKDTCKKLFLVLFVVFTTNISVAEILQKVEISGNTRISNETIKVYGEIEENKDYSSDEINSVIK